MKKQENCFYNDEIYLIDIIRLILKYKYFILIILFLTFSSMFIFEKSKDKLYSSKLVFDIGEVYDENNLIEDKSRLFHLDELNNLKELLSVKYNVDSSFLKYSGSIFNVTIIRKEEELIRKLQEEIKKFILERHQQKALFYKSTIVKVTKTKLLKITNIKEIKEKKYIKYIAALFITFFLSLFVIFILEFIRNLKRENYE